MSKCRSREGLDREGIMFKTITFSGLGLRFPAPVRVRVRVPVRVRLGVKPSFRVTARATNTI